MKSEVKALEYAASALVAKLDMLLTCEIGLSGLLDARHGLRINTPEHLHIGSDAFVTIHPVGWTSGTCIHARFYRGSHGWELLEGGMIENPDLAISVDRIRFKPSDGPIGIRLDPFCDAHKCLAKAGYEQLIASLREDAKNF